VIAPEIDHQLVELSLALDGAQQARLLQLKNHHARRVHRVHRHAALYDDVGRGIAFVKLAAAHADGLQRSHFFLNGSVHDGLRRQLLVEVSRDANPADSAERLRRRAETAPIEKMQDALLVG
jgi:hypothetical protein